MYNKKELLFDDCLDLWEFAFHCETIEEIKEYEKLFWWIWKYCVEFLGEDSMGYYKLDFESRSDDSIGKHMYRDTLHYRLWACLVFKQQYNLLSKRTKPKKIEYSFLKKYGT